MMSSVCIYIYKHICWVFGFLIGCFVFIIFLFSFLSSKTELGTKSLLKKTIA